MEIADGENGAGCSGQRTATRTPFPSIVAPSNRRAIRKFLARARYRIEGKCSARSLQASVFVPNVE